HDGRKRISAASITQVHQFTGTAPADVSEQAETHSDAAMRASATDVRLTAANEVSPNTLAGERPKITSRSTSIDHGSPSTSMAAMIAHPSSRPMRIPDPSGQSRQTRFHSAITNRGARMSLTRIHNLSISLDGFATGEPQAADAPFG